MFTWWNAAFKVPGSYTPEAFSRYFTPDAVLMLDGRVSVRGVEGWATHFQQIQSHGGSVEIIIPFKEEFQVGDKIYTYHMIKAVRNGVTSCELAAGHAVIRDGKIALVNLVRAPIDRQGACPTHRARRDKPFDRRPGSEQLPHVVSVTPDPPTILESHRRRPANRQSPSANL